MSLSSTGQLPKGILVLNFRKQHNKRLCNLPVLIDELNFFLGSVVCVAVVDNDIKSVYTTKPNISIFIQSRLNYSHLARRNRAGNATTCPSNCVPVYSSPSQSTMVTSRFLTVFAPHVDDQRQRVTDAHRSSNPVTCRTITVPDFHITLWW